MKFKIFKEMFRYFPEFNVGVIVVKGIDNSKREPKVVSLFNEAIDYIRLTYTPEKDVNPKLISKHLAKSPLISVWKAAYEEFGVKKHYNTNVETLMTNIIAGKTPKSRNNLADMCSYISLKQIIPIGVYDLDKIEGDIFLGLAVGGEKFFPADSKGVEVANKNEVVYSHAGGIMCRRWNWKESRRTQVTGKTKNAIILIDALPPVTESKLKAILKETTELIEMACGGKIISNIASKKKDIIELK